MPYSLAYAVAGAIVSGLLLGGAGGRSVLVNAASSQVGIREQAEPPKATPPMQAILDQLKALGGKPIETLSAEEARKQPTPADAVKALLKAQGKPADPEAVGNIDDRSIPGPEGKISIRIYRPQGEGPFPVVVYYHGGGWVIADLDTYDATPRALVNAAGCMVVSCHYRQAPEHKFPAAHEDAAAAYTWVVRNAASIKGDPACIAVAGESAGGNMAAAVALMARDGGTAPPVHQLLIYPVAGADMSTPSYQENAQAKPLNKAMMKWFLDKALRSPEEADDWKLSLLRAPRLAGLPPATVITAQIDPLRSEGKAYADRLKEAGVPVMYKNYEGVAHEFFGMGAVLPEAKEAQALAAAELRKAFARAQRK